MHRNRTWLLDPIELRTQRNRILPIEGGDGSTLSLDFTTGILDPRLTFTRDSNATFINSSGLVQYADANMMRNSSWSDSNPVPTSWSGAGNTPTTPATGSRTFTVTTAANSYIAEGGSSATGSQGVVYTAAVEVTAVSGSPTYNNTILATASPTGVSWYRNGVAVNGTDAVQTGVISYVFTSGSGSFVRIGLGASGGSVTNQSITMTKPRLMPGVRVDSPYFPSASATNQYQAPRFDHDPTTLAPRGLLIEGTATSLSRSSQDLTNATYWTLQTAYASTSATGGTAPDGTNTGNLFTEPSSNLQRSIYQSYSSAAGTYTFSVWLKAGSGSTRYMRLVVSSGAGDFGYVTINMSTGAIQQAATVVGTATNASATVSGNYTATGWRRYSLTVTLAASVNFVFLVPTDLASIDTPTTNYGRISYLGDGSSFLAWGAQLEAGSGASSYIPTGASQGSRALDSCYIAGGNFSSWFSTGAGTVVAQSDNTSLPTSGSQNLIGNFSDSTSANYIRMGYRVGGGNTELLLTSVSSAIQGSPDSGFTPSLNTMYKSAYAWDTNSFACVANGGAVGTDSSGTLASAGVITSLTIGGDFYQTSGPNSIYMKNGHIRSLKYWPTRLPNAQLQSLTT